MECIYGWGILWGVWEALSGVDEKWGFEQRKGDKVTIIAYL